MNNWWSQIKTAGSAIYANRHFLDLYRRTKQLDRLAKQGNKSNDASNDDGLICTIIGDVYIHPSANIHPTATVKLVLCLSSERFSSVKIAFLLFFFFCCSWGQMFRSVQMSIFTPVCEYVNRLSWIMLLSMTTHWCYIALVCCIQIFFVQKPIKNLHFMPKSKNMIFFADMVKKYAFFAEVDRKYPLYG